MKNALIILCLGVPLISHSQSNLTCSEEEFIDPNSITKCNISVSNDFDEYHSKTLFVKVKAKPSRFSKRKKHLSNNNTNKYQKKREIISNYIDQLEINNKKLKNSLENISIISNHKKIKTVKFYETSIIPLFEKCKVKSSEKNIACFNKQMEKHIAKHFEYPEEAISLKSQGDVWVKFIIDYEGNIKNIKTTGPKNGDLLEKEAKKLVSSLPKFKPGMKGDKKVNVSYALPISFSLN